METSIGQGKTLVTPFHMALIASAIANDGVLMKPYVIDRITDAEGEVVEQYEPAEYKHCSRRAMRPFCRNICAMLWRKEQRPS